MGTRESHAPTSVTDHFKDHQAHLRHGKETAGYIRGDTELGTRASEGAWVRRTTDKQKSMTLIEELKALVEKYGYDPKAGGLEPEEKDRCAECKEFGSWCRCHEKYK